MNSKPPKQKRQYEDKRWMIDHYRTLLESDYAFLRYKAKKDFELASLLSFSGHLYPDEYIDKQKRMMENVWYGEK